MIFLILIGSALAVTPVQPIGVSDEIIRAEHQQTRDWCQSQWNEKEQQLQAKLEQEKEALETQMREVLWWDRILSFSSLLLASFLALTFRSFLDHRNKIKIHKMEKQEAENRDKLNKFMEEDIGKTPKPIRDYGNR